MTSLAAGRGAGLVAIFFLAGCSSEQHLAENRLVHSMSSFPNWIMTVSVATAR